MKVLIDHPAPFALAHGGFQVQIGQTKGALESAGIEVEYVRWWDENQTGQIIHYFGRPTASYIDFAHAKGIKIVVGELLSALGSRSVAARLLQKSVMQVARTTLPASFLNKLAWDAYQKADAFVANTEWESYLMQNVFGAAPEKVHVIPNGVEDVFFQSASDAKLKPTGKYLVCTAVIHPRKRVVELARAAVLAKVPVWIIGKPYAESDPYFLQFLAIQKANPDFVCYEGSVSDRSKLAAIYKQARGFVLLSTMETLSLSSFEAAAAKCPLLLSDLPWARSAFGTNAAYAGGSMEPHHLAPILRAFYDNAPSPQFSFQPPTWPEVGELFKAVYVKVIGS